MVVAVCIFELHIPGARDLKQKRKIVKSLVDRIFGRFRVSIAETGHHDLHQRAELGLAAVAQSESEGRRIADAVRAELDQLTDAYVTTWDLDWVELR